MTIDVEKLDDEMYYSDDNLENLVYIEPMKKKKRKKTGFREMLETVFFCLLVAVIFRAIFYPISINGESMMPNYYDQEHGLMVKSNMFMSIDRFDVVVVDAVVSSGEKLIIKRVIGLPNETLEIRDSVLYINGVEVLQPFIDTGYQQNPIDVGPIVIPEDQYFVLGDNRDRSEDSRMIGTIKRDQIISKGGVIFWPLNKIKIIN